MKIALSILGIIAIIAIGAGVYLVSMPPKDDPLANFSDAKKAAIEARAEKQALDLEKEKSMVEALKDAKAAAKLKSEQESQ